MMNICRIRSTRLVTHKNLWTISLQIHHISVFSHHIGLVLMLQTGNSETRYISINTYHRGQLWNHYKRTYVVVFRASLYSLPWLLCDSHQAQLSLATDVMVLLWCMVHANDKPQGHHWHEPSNGQWHMHGQLHMHAPLKFSIKEMHATSPGSLFGWLWVGTHHASPHYL